MEKRDPRVDAYIRKAKPFAKPILARIRSIVHRANPRFQESIKWRMPAFLVDGQIVCGMAGFTAHAAFWFWNGNRLRAKGILKKEWMTGGMGALGKLTKVKDLPSSPALVRAVRLAAELRLSGVRKSKA